MGLFIAFLTFIDFSADVLRLDEWQSFSAVAIAVTVVNTLILLPAWLIILSFTLQKAIPEYSERDDPWSLQARGEA
jgi:hypothetical protein